MKTMKLSMKKGTHQILSFLFVLCLSLASFSCGNKSNEGGTTQMISGANSKIWKANKETDAAGDKVKQSKEEKSQQIQFFSNGNFTQTSNSESGNGSWSYDQATKTLSLTYANNNVSENFAVTELDEKNLTLKAPDGSTMELKAE